MERRGEALLWSVGCYELESEGVQLFDQVDGDYFAILGLPLIGLLDFLRLETAYDRDAWNLLPVAVAHEVLARQGKPEAATIWEDVFTLRTEEMAETHLEELESLQKKYGMNGKEVSKHRPSGTCRNDCHAGCGWCGCCSMPANSWTNSWESRLISTTFERPHVLCTSDESFFRISARLNRCF